MTDLTGSTSYKSIWSQEILQLIFDWCKITTLANPFHKIIIFSLHFNTITSFMGQYTDLFMALLKSESHRNNHKYKLENSQ